VVNGVLCFKRLENIALGLVVLIFLNSTNEKEISEKSNTRSFVSDRRPSKIKPD